MRSNVNLSNIVRTAGCCGITRLIACGSPKIDKTIARDGAEQVQIEVHRTLPPVLKELKADGYTLVGLEQTTNSVSLHEYRFPRRTALIIGNERLGLTDEELRLIDCVVEIPVWGLPHAYNVANATAMALYEYCRQWPTS
jgi:tRNA G18 (ribose-2'-O)-methylase SpoU